MDLTDFHQRILGFPQQAYGQQEENDLSRARWGSIGQIGLALLGASGRMPSGQRNAVLAQGLSQVQDPQQVAMNFAQQRLMQSVQQAKMAELQRQDAIRQKLSDPNYLKGLGLNPQAAEVLGPEGIARVLQAQAARNPLDDEYKRTMIDYTKSGKGRTDPYQDTVDRERAQFDARMEQGKRLGLTGEDLTQYASTGKIQTANEKQTQDQANSALFSSRMDASNKIISDPNIYKYGMGIPGFMNKLNEMIPVIGHGATDPQFQQYDQAQRDFVNAVLRRESGSAISQGEFENARKQYFPQVGDSDEVLKQKAANRELAIKGIFEAASPQYRRSHPLSSADAPPAAAPSAPSMPQPGDVVRGYRFKGGNPADRNSWEPVR